MKGCGMGFIGLLGGLGAFRFKVQSLRFRVQSLVLVEWQWSLEWRQNAAEAYL